MVSELVVAEITDPGQVQQLQEALQRHGLRQEAITTLYELTVYAELRRIMGQGEASCVALCPFLRAAVCRSSAGDTIGPFTSELFFV